MEQPRWSLATFVSTELSPVYWTCLSLKLQSWCNWQWVIENPDAVFDTTDTICISSNSDPTPGLCGCPAGAAHYQQADFGIAVSKYIATGKRSLFKRGAALTGDISLQQQEPIRQVFYAVELMCAVTTLCPVNTALSRLFLAINLEHNSSEPTFDITNQGFRFALFLIKQNRHFSSSKKSASGIHTIFK